MESEGSSRVMRCGQGGIWCRVGGVEYIRL